MKEIIYEIVLKYSPVVAGFIVTVIIPLLFNKFCKKTITKKVNDLDKDNQLKKINKELSEIKREILEMRGKIK